MVEPAVLAYPGTSVTVGAGSSGTDLPVRVDAESTYRWPPPVEMSPVEMSPVEMSMSPVEMSPVEQRSPDLAAVIQQVADRGIQFHVVSNESVRPHLNLNPYGHPLSWLDFTRTTRLGWSTEEFLNLFNVMNGVAFGARGIPMPRWVMIDLALMPSAALVATMSQELFDAMVGTVASADTRQRMCEVLEGARANGYDGPIPVGGYCASPSAARGRWVGWSLWSVVPRSGVGLATKALALAAYRVQRLDGVTQYDNTALRVHTRFGRLRVVAATVPFHTVPGSFVYENDLSLPVDSRPADSSPPVDSRPAGSSLPVNSRPADRRPVDDQMLRPTFLLDPADLGQQRMMQAAIEAGEADFFILAPGWATDNGRTVVPVLQVPRTSRQITDALR